MILSIFFILFYYVATSRSVTVNRCSPNPCYNGGVCYTLHMFGTKICSCNSYSYYYYYGNYNFLIINDNR